MLNLIEVILIAIGVATWVFILMCLCGLITFSTNIESKAQARLGWLSYSILRIT